MISAAKINAARINIAKNNQKISLLEFRKTLEENIAESRGDVLAAGRRRSAKSRSSKSSCGRPIDLAHVLLDKEGETNRQQISQTNERVETDRALLVRAAPAFAICPTSSSSS